MHVCVCWFSRVCTRTSFVLLFAMGIFSISLLNYSRKSYLLKNDYQITSAKIDFARSSLDRLIITYEIGQVEYTKRVDVIYNDIIKLSGDRVVLKYASVNPLICEVVNKSDSIIMKP